MSERSKDKLSKGLPHVAFVRLSDVIYRKLCREQLLTGRSIPWIIRTRLESATELTPPAFDHEQGCEIIRQLSALGNNANQIAKRCNAGVERHAEHHLAEIHRFIKGIHDLAVRDYGRR